ncbi:MAG: hypothetical protein ACLQBY_14940 [Solirubrobacteraceae bacterium]
MRTALLVIGGLLQVGGFGWALTAATHALGDEYAEYGVFKKVWRWLAFWLGPPPVSQKASATISAEGGGTASATGHKVTETDIERLEHDIAILRADFERHRDAIDQRVSGLQAEHQKQHGEVLQRINTIEARERQRRYEQLRRERYAAFTFLLGVTLTTVGALV